MGKDVMEAVVLFIVKGAKDTIFWIQFTWAHRGGVIYFG